MTDFVLHSFKFIIRFHPATRHHKICAFEKASLNELNKSNHLKEVNVSYANCAACELHRVRLNRNIWEASLKKVLSAFNFFSAINYGMYFLQLQTLVLASYSFKNTNLTHHL
jgi:hypothetical protein